MKLCALCGRHVHRGRQISRRGLAKKKGGVGKKITGISPRTFKPNLQRVRALVDGKVVRLRVCAACIRAGKVTKPRTKLRPPKPPPGKPVVARAEGGSAEGSAPPEGQSPAADAGSSGGAPAAGEGGPAEGAAPEGRA